MKSKIALFVCALSMAFAMSGCRAHYPVAQESGKDDVAYVIFVSAGNARNTTVDVSIDGATSFAAKTVKSRKANRRGTQYSVNPGKRKLTVRKDGRILYDKYIFLSTQETKEITLP